MSGMRMTTAVALLISSAVVATLAAPGLAEEASGTASKTAAAAVNLAPEAEDDAEVLAMLVVLHQIVVPDVQSRRIQKITEGSPVQIEIGVIQMADDRCEDGNPEDNPRINV